MKKTQILAIATLAAAATFQSAAKAEDPVSPVPGAVCSLYLTEVRNDSTPKSFIELASSLPQQPALSTFVDSAGDFKDVDKKDNLNSNAGMWTGWFKQDKAGTYTFLCTRFGPGDRMGGYRYGIWINGKKCLEGVNGQTSFNVELNAGFNSIRIILESFYPSFASYGGSAYPLTISYQKAGSVQDPVSFGPGDMFYDDEE